MWCVVSVLSDVVYVEVLGVIDWYVMGFGLMMMVYMFKVMCEFGGEWVVEGVVSYGDLSLSLLLVVLNYG